MCTKNDLVTQVALFAMLTCGVGCRGSSTPTQTKAPSAVSAESPSSTKQDEKLGSSNGVASFDYDWWLKASSDERRGFLAGFMDCYVDDLRNPIRFDQSWATYEARITSGDSVAKRSEDVWRLIPSLGHHDATILRNKPHEGFGDGWWRQDSDSARTGFVEGYFTCRKTSATSPKWSKKVADYVLLLDDEYNADDRKGMDAHEFDGSIADALYKYRDQ